MSDIVTSLDKLSPRIRARLDLVNEQIEETNDFRTSNLTVEDHAKALAQNAGAYDAAVAKAEEILANAKAKADAVMAKAKEAAKAEKANVLAPFMAEAESKVASSNVNPIEASAAEKELAALKSGFEKALSKEGLTLSQVEHFLVDEVAKKGARVSFGTKSETDYNGASAADVRRWAIEKGLVAADSRQGRLSHEIIDAYKQENPAA